MKTVIQQRVDRIRILLKSIDVYTPTEVGLKQIVEELLFSLENLAETLPND